MDVEQKRAALQEEDNLYDCLKRVAESEDGYTVITWILCRLCCFWGPSISGMADAERGRYDVGRAIYNALVLASVDAAFRVLQDRRTLAESDRNAEKQLLKGVDHE